MWGSTCIPRTVYQVLSPLKRPFRCAQGQPLLVFCWLVMALLRDPSQGTLKGLGAYLPPKLPYWTTLRMGRSGPGDALTVLEALAAPTLHTLPPPADGGLYLIGDSPLQEQRGRKHPLGHTPRHRASAPYTFGFALVLLSAIWDHARRPR